MTVIKDPFSDNYAIVDGKHAVAVRIIPAGAIEDPSAPRLSEIRDARIIGYTTEPPFGVGNE